MTLISLFLVAVSFQAQVICLPFSSAPSIQFNPSSSSLDISPAASESETDTSASADTSGDSSSTGSSPSAPPGLPSSFPFGKISKELLMPTGKPGAMSLTAAVSDLNERLNSTIDDLEYLNLFVQANCTCSATTATQIEGTSSSGGDVVTSSQDGLEDLKNEFEDFKGNVDSKINSAVSGAVSGLTSTEDLNTVKSDVKSLTDRMVEVENGNEDQAAQSQIASLESRLLAVETAASSAPETVSSDDFQAVQGDVASLKEAMNTCQEEACSDLTSTVKVFNTSLTSLQQNVQSLSTHLDEVTSGTPALQSAVQTLQDDFNNIQTSMESSLTASTDVESVKTDMTELGSRMDSFQSGCSGNSATVSTLSTQIEELRSDVTTMQSNSQGSNDIESQIQQLSATTETLSGTQTDVTAQIADLVSTIQSLSDRIHTLETQPAPQDAANSDSTEDDTGPTITEYIRIDSTKSWSMSQDICREAGGILAVLNSDDKIAQAASAIEAYDELWVGFRRNNEGNFEWTDGTQLTSFQLNGNYDYPQDYKHEDGSLCGTVSKPNGEIKFEVKHCDEPSFSILCEVTL